MKTKKELKSEYKEMKFQMGVFQIKNTLNGKIFIDSSLNVLAKWNRHHAQLKFGSHRNKNLQLEWNEFGADAFEYALVSELEYEDSEVNYGKELEILAALYLEELQPFGEKGYNKPSKK